jgi:hypothetical protein
MWSFDELQIRRRRYRVETEGDVYQRIGWIGDQSDRIDGATDAVIEQTMTQITPTSGVCEYQFAAGELVSPSMSFEVRITDSGGFIVRSLQLVNIPVRQQLP